MPFISHHPWGCDFGAVGRTHLALPAGAFLCGVGLFCVVWGFLACGFTVGKGNSSSGEAGRRGQRGEMQWEFL